MPPDKSAQDEALPEYVTMYEVSGQDEISVHAYERYMRDKGADEQIRQAAEDSLPNLEKKIRSNTSEYTIAPVIEEGLANKDVRLQELYAGMIGKAPERQRGHLIEIALATDESKVQKKASDFILYTPADVRAGLQEKLAEVIRQGLAQPDPALQETYSGLIGCTSELQIGGLIEQVFTTGSIRAQKVCAGQIGFADPLDHAKLVDELTSIIERGMADTDVDTQVAYARMTQYASPDKRSELESRKLELVHQGLASADPSTRKAWARVIRNIPSDKTIFVEEAFATGDLEVAEICMRAGSTESLAPFGELPVEVQDRLRVQIGVAVARGLEGDDMKTQGICLRMLKYAPDAQKNSLLQIAKDRLGDAVVEPPLYKDKAVSDDSLSRVGFEKTGSKTTLIGGELKGKTIIRQIEPDAFMTWERLYDDHKLWKGAGLDYVPIEPIQSFKLDREGLVDVFSGVLDLSFRAWSDMGGEFLSELKQDRQRIVDILQAQGIKHGHTHDDNFCLRFFRDENGKVDFSRKPRIYLIDFDQAVSPAP